MENLMIKSNFSLLTLALTISVLTVISISACTKTSPPTKSGTAGVVSADEAGSGQNSIAADLGRETQAMAWVDENLSYVPAGFNFDKPPNISDSVYTFLDKARRGDNPEDKIVYHQGCRNVPVVEIANGLRHAVLQDLKRAFSASIKSGLAFKQPLDPSNPRSSAYVALQHFMALGDSTFLRELYLTLKNSYAANGVGEPDFQRCPVRYFSNFIAGTNGSPVPKWLLSIHSKKFEGATSEVWGQAYLQNPGLLFKTSKRVDISLEKFFGIQMTLDNLDLLRLSEQYLEVPTITEKFCAQVNQYYSDSASAIISQVDHLNRGGQYQYWGRYNPIQVFESYPMLLLLPQFHQVRWPADTDDVKSFVTTSPPDSIQSLCKGHIETAFESLILAQHDLLWNPSFQSHLQGNICRKSPNLPSCKKANDVSFADVEKEADGRPKMTNHDSAANYCKSFGKRLFAMRDLAKLAAKRGAKGVVQQCGDWMPECSKEKVLNSNGVRDDFFYDRSGYDLSGTEDDDYVIWSSSEQAPYNDASPPSLEEVNLVINVMSGEIDSQILGYGAILCAPLD